MKTKLFILTTSLIVTFGCKNFLDENLEGDYSSATFYKTQTHALLAVSGIYNTTTFNSTDNVLWVFGDVCSDDAVKGGQAGDQSDITYLEQFNYLRSNSYLDKIWKRYYEGITRTNYFLYYGQNINMDTSLKNRLLGEAKFLRAYFYFNLVNIFGAIPIKLTPPLNTDEINKPTSPVASVYQQIETDLNDAIQVLPKNYAGIDVGRATQGSAWGLLAKVHLYQQQYDKVLTDVAAIQALGVYSLTPRYYDSFVKSTQNNSESIFEIQHMAGQIPSLGSNLPQWLGPFANDAGIAGYGFDSPLQNLVDEFEVTTAKVVDPRLDYTLGRPGQKWVNGEDFNASWTVTGYCQKKHEQPKTDLISNNLGDAGLNYVYIRYADILLMQAEALNELGRTDEALVPLNAVRKRARESYLYDARLSGYGSVPAGLLPDRANTDKESVRSYIRHERRVELALEFHRYFDLMRYGKAVAEAALNSTKFNYEQNRYFLIPQSELDTNPRITN